MMFPVEAFILSKFYEEYKEWVDEQEANLRAASLEEQERNRKPFDLDKMVEEALAVVQKTIENSRHNYACLPKDHFGRNLGFVTKEGYSAYQCIDYPLGGFGSCIIDSFPFSPISPISTLSTLRPLSVSHNLQSLFGVAVFSSQLPKWLRAFARDITC